MLQLIKLFKQFIKIIISVILNLQSDFMNFLKAIFSKLLTSTL